MNHNHLALVRFLSGLLLTAITIALYLWQKDIHPWDIKVINSIVLVTIAYTLTTVSINKLQTFPGRQSWLHKIQQLLGGQRATDILQSLGKY